MPRKENKKMHKFDPKKRLTLQTLCQENKNAKIRANKATNTTLQTLCQENKNAQIRPKKAPNTNLQKLLQEKKKKNVEPKMHLTLP